MIQRLHFSIPDSDWHNWINNPPPSELEYLECTRLDSNELPRIVRQSKIDPFWNISGIWWREAKFEGNAPTPSLANPGIHVEKTAEGMSVYMLDKPEAERCMTSAQQAAYLALAQTKDAVSFKRALAALRASLQPTEVLDCQTVLEALCEALEFVAKLASANEVGLGRWPDLAANLLGWPMDGAKQAAQQAGLLG